MPKISRFIPKDERIAKEKAEDARQAVLDLDLPQTATEAIFVTIARHENGGRLAEWKFNMLNPSQCLAIWNAIDKLPTKGRPYTVRRVFDYVLTHIEQNTGIVTLTREELAEALNVRPQEVSTAMGILEEMKVVFRERVKVAGMRGPGVARYRLNQWVAWNGDLGIRKEQAKQIPLPFDVLEGGKRP